VNSNPAIQELQSRPARTDQRLGLRTRDVRPAQASEREPLKREAYLALIARIRDTVDNSLPRGTIVMVVSKGDDELLKLGECQTWHFPRTEHGMYAGHHPADSTAAIQHLEELRASGGQFLLFPATAFWWLEHYSDFHRHLRERYATIVRDDQTCQIFDVRGVPHERKPKAPNADALQYANLIRQIRQVVDSLLPADAKVAVVSRGDPALLGLGTRQAWHLPLDSYGQYAGHHPANGREATRQAKAAHARGAQFLVLPSVELWWLEYYRELDRYLRSQCRLVVQQPHVCTIYEL
jgi:hypothetical protein